MSDFEIMAVNKLKSHLRIAKALDYPISKMHYIDGFLSALCAVTGKKYSFSETSVFIELPNGERQYI